MVSLFADFITSFGYSGVVLTCDKIIRGDVSAFTEICGTDFKGKIYVIFEVVKR